MFEPGGTRSAEAAIAAGNVPVDWGEWTSLWRGAVMPVEREPIVRGWRSACQLRRVRGAAERISGDIRHAHTNIGVSRREGRVTVPLKSLIAVSMISASSTVPLATQVTIKFACVPQSRYALLPRTMSKLSGRPSGTSAGTYFLWKIQTATVSGC